MKFFGRMILSAFLLAPSASGFAQVQWFTFPLAPIPELQQQKLKDAGGVKCGPYFYRAADSKLPGIAFAWIRNQGIEGRVMHRDVFLLAVNEDARVPRIWYVAGKIEGMGDLDYHWVVTMTKADATLAQPCLPPPIKAPPTAAIPSPVKPAQAGSVRKSI